MHDAAQHHTDDERRGNLVGTPFLPMCCDHYPEKWGDDEDVSPHSAVGGKWKMYGVVGKFREHLARPELAVEIGGEPRRTHPEDTCKKREQTGSHWGLLSLVLRLSAAGSLEETSVKIIARMNQPVNQNVPGWFRS